MRPTKRAYYFLHTAKDLHCMAVGSSSNTTRWSLETLAASASVKAGIASTELAPCSESLFEL